jgi:energy-coupling factor transport system ATP-binding protein
LDRPTAAPAAIEISHLSYRYPLGVVALKDVSLTVTEGSFVAIVGPNGAGKSTLASHLIGRLRPAPGAVRLFGQDARDLPSRDLTRLIGYVFQNPEHQFVAGTVYDELAFGPRVRGWSEAEVKARVDAMLADVGLAALGPANPFTLSHGEKRRLSVASILILEPRVLVLDEPTFGQDRQNTDALVTRLTALNRAGRTVVMITHDVRLVAECAHEVVVLSNGEVTFHGSADSLFANPTLLRQSHFVVPPILEMSRRLTRWDASFPEVLTVDRFEEVFPSCTAPLVEATAEVGAGGFSGKAASQDWPGKAWQ